MNGWLIACLVVLGIFYAAMVAYHFGYLKVHNEALYNKDLSGSQIFFITLISLFWPVLIIVYAYDKGKEWSYKSHVLKGK
jgi:hypothetical protein